MSPPEEGTDFISSSWYRLAASVMRKQNAMNIDRCASRHQREHLFVFTSFTSLSTLSNIERIEHVLNLLDNMLKVQTAVEQQAQQRMRGIYGLMGKLTQSATEEAFRGQDHGTADVWKARLEAIQDKRADLSSTRSARIERRKTFDEELEQRDAALQAVRRWRGGYDKPTV